LLGSAGISPYEVITAYSTIARSGVYMKPTVLLRVEDSRGREIKLDKPKPERRFDPEPVNNLISILQDVVEKGTGKNAIIPGRPVAGKTGTTDEMRDIWFTGFTSDMVGSVWMGNDKYIPLHGVFSSNCATVWGNFAREHYKMYPSPVGQFPKPEKIIVGKQVIGDDKAKASLEPAVTMPPTPNTDSMRDNPDFGHSPLSPGAGAIPSKDLKPLVEPKQASAPVPGGDSQ
jgi:membrane peptidoglycan carboxypeptidase